MSVALFLAGFATFSLIYCTQPLLPVFCAEFGISPATSSLSVSLTTGFLAVSILCAAAGSESLGRRGLMAASISVAATLNLLCAVAPSWTVLLVLRGAEGFALGGMPAVAMAYIAEEVPASKLGRVMGLYVGGTAFGGMAGRVAMGALTSLFSWRVAIGCVAILDLAAAVAFVVLLPESRNFVRQRGLGVGDHISAWSAHLRNGSLDLLFLTGFLAMSAFVTVYNYASFRLAAQPYNLDEAQIGLIFFAYIFGVVASPLAGTWAARIGRGPTLVIGAA
ncbi:MAG: MFS transporter, partial [Janthinobacterium lividum]